jgi:hypothetical protein
MSAPGKRPAQAERRRKAAAQGITYGSGWCAVPLVVLLSMSGCAHSVRPDYYTPERCFELKDRQATAGTVEAVAQKVALGFVAGGVASEALDKAGVNTGPATLIVAGLALISGAVSMGAESSGESAKQEWGEACSMPAPVVQ